MKSITIAVDGPAGPPFDHIVIRYGAPIQIEPSPSPDLDRVKNALNELSFA